MNEICAEMVIVTEKQMLINEAFRHVKAIESILTSIDEKMLQKKK